jgi:hypothetical protein
MTQTGSPDPRIDLVCITSSCPRQFLQNFKTPSSLPGLTSLYRSGFDATSLWHFDAAESAPSTASFTTKAGRAKGPCTSASPRKRTISRSCWQVRLVPCVDGSELARLFFTFAGWSVQPCVRPICAVHMTAGHNALRGSGPGQKPAFDNALALVGCPDRRIAGSALRAVRPPNLHITPNVGAILVTPQVRRVPCSDHPWPSWPTPFLRSCWRARSRRPWSAGAPTML